MGVLGGSLSEVMVRIRVSINITIRIGSGSKFVLRIVDNLRFLLTTEIVLYLVEKHNLYRRFHSQNRGNYLLKYLCARIHKFGTWRGNLTSHLTFGLFHVSKLPVLEYLCGWCVRLSWLSVGV